jgi:hypothetical protein
MQQAINDALIAFIVAPAHARAEATKAAQRQVIELPNKLRRISDEGAQALCIGNSTVGPNSA